MPLTIPAFVQYQQPLVPLRGLWNHAPAEGDFFINANIQWGVTTGATTCVQFSLAGNSPVALSQIAALAVDNSRCGADVAFIFPDSGFKLVVPAHEGGIFAVLTNALTFYADAATAIAGDETVFQVCNSCPPVIPISPTFQQNHASVSGIDPATNGATAIIAAGISGTLNTLALSIDLLGGAAEGGVELILSDGMGGTVWINIYHIAASATFNEQVNLPGLNLRFVNGLNLQIVNSAVAGTAIVVNAYYSTP